MPDPKVPHIIGITLDSQGVATSKVTLTNLSSGGIQIVATNASKLAIIDCANFDNAYSNGDVIGYENSGASFGGGTVTIDTALGMQEVLIDSTASSTTAVLGM